MLKNITFEISLRIDAVTDYRDFIIKSQPQVNKIIERKQLRNQGLTKKTGTTQHDCLPCLQGDGDKGTEIVYGEENNTLYLLSRLEQPRQAKNLLYQQDKPDEPTNEGRAPLPLSKIL
jgi:hypothetical protein